jgi:putative acetyltransferase
MRRRYSVIEIRVEQPKDIDEVRVVNDKAFGQPEEGRLVDKLRKSCNGVLSLVAISNNIVVGHILFSPVTVESPSGVIEGMGLAPMAVLPEFQNRGIGSKLVNEGLRIIGNTTCPFVVVLGHEKYYPRFGFQRASDYGLKTQWEGVPDEAFMAMILDESIMKGMSGIARYRDEFDEVMKKA